LTPFGLTISKAAIYKIAQKILTKLSKRIFESTKAWRNKTKIVGGKGRRGCGKPDGQS